MEPTLAIPPSPGPTSNVSGGDDREELSKADLTSQKVDTTSKSDPAAIKERGAEVAKASVAVQSSLDTTSAAPSQVCDFSDGFECILTPNSERYLPHDLEIVLVREKEAPVVYCHRFVLALSSRFVERKLTSSDDVLVRLSSSVAPRVAPLFLFHFIFFIH